MKYLLISLLFFSCAKKEEKITNLYDIYQIKQAIESRCKSEYIQKYGFNYYKKKEMLFGDICYIRAKLVQYTLEDLNEKK